MHHRRQDHFWLTATIILLATNALDATLTLCAVEFGDATEANPLMEALLAHGPTVFVVVKHLLVSLGLVLLWRFRARPLARAGAWLVLPIYPAIVAYELSYCLS
jgi:Domain of unknown function (DUF5658)